MKAGKSVAVAGVSIALVGLGVGISFLLHSPDETLTVVLPERPLTTVVESQSLKTEITGVGAFSDSGGTSLYVTPPANRSLVVSATPIKRGKKADWCKPVVEVAGRPVFILKGRIPAYRDLTEGDSGNDVRQLQLALRDCGYLVSVDSYFGAQTAKAVNQMYVDSGYKAPYAVEEALGAVVGSDSSALAGEVSWSNAVMFTQISIDDKTSGAGEKQEPEGEQSEDKSSLDRETIVEDKPKIVAARGEIKFLTARPKVSKLQKAGTELSGEAVAELSFGGDEFHIRLPAEHIGKIAQGQVIDLTYLDWTFSTQLPELPEVPTYGEDTEPTLDFTIQLDDGAPEGARGEQGQYSIIVGSDRLYDLVVPVSAVYQDTSGQHFVWKYDDSANNQSPETQASTQRVNVTVLESANGYVAIEPVEGTLAVKDSVVIGQQ